MPRRLRRKPEHADSEGRVVGQTQLATPRPSESRAVCDQRPRRRAAAQRGGARAAPGPCAGTFACRRRRWRIQLEAGLGVSRPASPRDQWPGSRRASESPAQPALGTEVRRFAGCAPPSRHCDIRSGYRATDNLTIVPPDPPTMSRGGPAPGITAWSPRRVRLGEIKCHRRPS